MTPETLQAIQTHAGAEYPRECCGLIVMVGGAEHYRPCRNLAASASEHFVLAPEDLADAYELGEVLAVVHSHPDESAAPSDADRAQCEESGLTWHIVSVGQVDGVPSFGELRTIEPAGYVAPLLGRQFAHGILDCWTLVRDFYSRELGITLVNPAREDDWWHNGQDLYNPAGALHDAGFRPASGSLRRGDLILMQVRCKDVPNHAGVYLGDQPLAEAGGAPAIPNAMLHHLYGRLSERVPYGGYWANATRYVLRHLEAP